LRLDRGGSGKGRAQPLVDLTLGQTAGIGRLGAGWFRAKRTTEPNTEQDRRKRRA
jgi:hypothetical protein